MRWPWPRDVLYDRAYRVCSGTLSVVKGLLGPLRACLIPENSAATTAAGGDQVHPQSRAFLLASAVGAVLQAIEEQVQATAAAAAFRAKGVRACLAAQLELDIEQLEGEVRLYEAYGHRQPAEAAGVLETVPMLLTRMGRLRSAWCNPGPVDEA